MGRMLEGTQLVTGEVALQPGTSGDTMCLHKITGSAVVLVGLQNVQFPSFLFLSEIISLFSASSALPLCSKYSQERN